MAFYILSCGKRRGREGIINYEKRLIQENVVF
jgi:hypothetical protein